MISQPELSSERTIRVRSKFGTVATPSQTKKVPTWRIWLIAGRVPTLTAGAVPVILGTAAAVQSGHYRPGVFLPTLLASLLIQLGTNLANDYFDYFHGADVVEEDGLARTLPAGLLTPEQVRKGSIVAFCLAIAFGLFLVFTGGGWPILMVGLSCIAAGVLYTGGPWPLGYHGLGDLLTFLFFGLVAVSGTFYLYAGSLSYLPFLLALPVGFLVTAILVANNLRDVKSDQLVGKYTLAVMLGPAFARFEYIALTGLAFLVPPVLWQLGLAPPTVLIPGATLPIALIQFLKIRNSSGLALNQVLNRAALLHLTFGISLAVGLLL